MHPSAAFVFQETAPTKGEPSMKKTPKPRSNAAGKSRVKPTPSSPMLTGLATNGFPIVGIGASAGGLDALMELFEHMPNDTGLGFVVVTHQHPDHASMLPELLSKVTTLRVIEAADGMKIESNRIHVSAPGGCLALLNGSLLRMEMGQAESPHLPIDSFFRSLAKDQKEKAVCIILSGTGTDGTLGLKAVKEESGLAIVQQVSTAKYAGMPSSALATGLADYVLPCKEMAALLLHHARRPFVASQHRVNDADAMPEPMSKIFVLLRERVGHDFSGYKPSTIRRRIERRMNMHEIKDVRDYLSYLQQNPHELDTLFKELLISVTSFFRDPEAFEMLADSALSALMSARPDSYTLRSWIPGCATGEEVYSLAILMRELMGTMKKPFEIQIFGTDLDKEALDFARNGQYPDEIAANISPERLEHFFMREDSGYRIRKDIREMIVFAEQNIIKDPPFTKLDLISCRNLLIYLNADLQKRLLPVFHYALKPGGLLLLGPSETIGGFTELFDVVDKKWKIFRRKESAHAVSPHLIFPVQQVKSDMEPRAMTTARIPRESNIASIVERLLITRFTPASVVVNDRGDAIYFHGRTGSYLEPAVGHPRLNVLYMAREGLQFELASALRQAVAGRTEVLRQNVRVRTNGDFTHVDLTVTSLQEPESLSGLFLITFQPRPSPVETLEAKLRDREDGEAGRTDELERELQSTKESLQTSIEDLEASYEELKSTNEELQSTNEELQSMNEELETSKEEMQSLNEELSTVNSEMHLKVDDLSQVNDDMQNLLNSTEIATVFLDNRLHIKRYTEQAPNLINLIPTDVGRPLADLASSLAYSQLVPDCQEVLRTLVSKLAEVQTNDGLWYLMRIMPYRTEENVIEGLVLTFVDINPVKDAEKTLHRMSKVFLDGLDPMIIMDLSGKMIELNDEAVRTYGWSRQEMLGQPVNMLVPDAQRKAFCDRLRRCREHEVIRNVRCVKVTKAGTEIKGLLTLSLLTDEKGQPESIAMAARVVNP